MHPRLLLRRDPTEGSRSIDAVKTSLTGGRTAEIWRALTDHVNADAERPPYTPTTVIPHRAAAQADVGNRDYRIVHAAAERIMRGALVWLLAGNQTARESCLEQMHCIFDEAVWPDWRDLAHLRAPADLRTGQFLRAIGFAFDWLSPSLTDTERDWILAGADRCGIQPYLQSLDEHVSWAFADEPNNWMTCVVGGAAIAGMGLGDAHPAADRLVEESIGRFEQYLDVLGPEGEFNESIGYAAAMRFPIVHFAALRSWSGGGQNQLLDPRLSAFCDWYMYFMLPPGVNAAFGDTHLGAPPQASMYAPMAAATRNPHYQWFYEAYGAVTDRSDLCLELICYDPEVPAVSPAGRMPRGRAYRGHSACWSSRTSWDADRAACVVYGKGGHGREKHGHHDAGTICLDGHNQRLLCDSGNLAYPADYFGANRCAYHNAAAAGHNVPVVGGREMRRSPEDAAVILASHFDDALGAAWAVDTTALYDGVKQVRRGVIHLLPGVLAVLDHLLLEQAEDVAIRWHTINRAEPDADGAFVVTENGVTLMSRMVNLQSTPMAWTRGEQTYEPPYDRDRIGQPLADRRESFVLAAATAKQVLLLSLFSLYNADLTPAAWQGNGARWQTTTPVGDVVVTVDNNVLRVAGPAGELSLEL